MKILAASSSDTTLVVQRPDGTYLCNDDAEGRNPVVSGSFPAGAYRVWIGSYRARDNSAYRLGFTELPGTRARNL